MPLRSYRGRWVADYVDQYGGRHRPSFPTRKEAKDHLIQKEAEIRSRTYNPESHKISIGDLAHEFLIYCEGRVRRGELDETTYRLYRGAIRRYVLAEIPMTTRTGRPTILYFPAPLAKVSLDKLRRQDVEAFKDRLLDENLASTTVKNITNVLAACLSWAQERNLVNSNVARNLRQRRARHEYEKSGGEVEIPEKEVLKALCDASNDYEATVIKFAASTGLRSSEQRALAWRHIDFERKTVKVDRRISGLGELGPPKTRAGRRVVPLSSSLVEDLRILRASSRFSGPDDLVFGNGVGNFENHGNWGKRIYNPAWEHVRRTWKGPVPPKRCKWHALRHFAISCWIEADVPVKQIQKWAGHASAKMTLDTYGHLFKSADHTDVVEQISKIW